MARYFFNLQADDRTIEDEVGEEFPSAEQARTHAVQVASELARNNPVEEHHRSVWHAIHGNA